MTQPHRELSNPEGVYPPVGKYSHVAEVTASKLLFLAGQVSVDVNGDLVGDGDVGAQVRQIYKNIGAVLAGGGATFADIVSINTYVVGRDAVQPYLDARTEVFLEIFPGEQFPPNTFLIIDGLLYEEYLVEISVTAALP
jgi:2-iminobutanoate/2-iminopropanoate deaminase